MTADMILFLALGAAAGGFINGLSGTGTALFALGFYLVVLPPTTSVAIVALMSVLVGLQGLWIVRASIFARPDRLARFILPGLAGVPLGLLLLDVIDTGTLRIGIAVFLIVYGGYFGFRAALPSFSRRTPIIDVIVGFLGGVLGGTAGVSGALPAMWLSVRPWTKSETRAVMQPLNMVILSTTVTLLFFKGAYDQAAVNALMITIPCGLVAAQVGIMVFRRLSDIGFRRLLILLTLAMGAGLLLSELT
ncbi:sulfite exporter TauE/SafE family protein [uncultured Tateyamaria sp.]|uniref:sulfite exporter TauE/SafE family protein n=1 Tax=uncultured Tateyamaria sp. TaxID=455651 RepID=UPI0026073694|nr:sulfite exporter TauE/SafE family protein [uncultured Tateyamaria sp.]